PTGSVDQASMRHEFELANHHGLILRRCLLEAPEIDAYGSSDLGNIGSVRGVLLGFDHLGNRSDRLSSIHQRKHDMVRKPLHPRRSQSSATDVKVVLPR